MFHDRKSTKLNVGGVSIEIDDYVMESGDESWLKDDIERQVSRKINQPRLTKQQAKEIAEDVVLMNLQEFTNKKNGLS